MWRSGDAVLLSGDYGDTSLPFPYEEMDRTHNGEAVMCQVDWVDRKNSTSFTANVACKFPLIFRKFIVTLSGLFSFKVQCASFKLIDTHCRYRLPFARM